MEPILSLYSHRNTDQWVALTHLSSEDRTSIEEFLTLLWLAQRNKEEQHECNRISLSYHIRASDIPPYHRMFSTFSRIAFHALHQAGWIPFVKNEEKTDPEQLSKYDLRIRVEQYLQTNEEEEVPETHLTSLNEIIQSDWIEGRGDGYRQGYVCILSIKQQNSCGITYYPNFIDESDMTTILTNFLFQCSVPHKELEIPLKQGNLLLMSGATYWKKHYRKGKEDAYTVTIYVMERE
jgi:hypothetical protein